MALIKCPECGKTVSDTARQCPHCGYNLQARNSFCPECHAPVDSDSMFCESCGTRLLHQTTVQKLHRKSLLWLWITLAALLVAGAAVFATIKITEASDSGTYEESVPVITEEDLVTSAAESYILAINRKDAETAKSYSTEETKDVVDAILTFASDQFKNYSRISYVDVSGESATAKVIRTGNKPLDMNLRKVDDEWKVEAAKETGDV